MINYSMSAVGNVQVEIQDAGGSPIEGYALGDAPEIVGDQIGRFVLKDADLYSIRFRGK